MKLGEVAEFLNGGAWSADEYAESGIPVVRVSDIKNETVVVSDDRKFLPSHLLNRYQKNLLQEGDVVVATVGSHPTQPASVVGRAARIPRHAHGNLLNQNAVCIRPIDDRLVRDYLRYVVVTPPFKQYVAANARGSANQVRMAISSLANMPLALPTPSVQRRVSDILSGYDDMIENNTRRIKILEDMAQMLYREWFVNFRFPGHEKVRMVESELGPIPEGWTVETFGGLFNIKYGKNLPTQLIGSSGAFPVYGAGSVIGYYHEGFVSDKVCLITCRGNGSGTVWRTRGAAFITNNSLMLFPRPQYSYCLCCFVELIAKHSNVRGVISGSAQPQITIEGLQSVPAIVPLESLVRRFCDTVGTMQEAVDSLYLRNANLRTTRDLLLPKLISGEIPVEAAADLMEQSA
jgi:type I restriction enzyme S subunit